MRGPADNRKEKKPEKLSKIMRKEYFRAVLLIIIASVLGLFWVSVYVFDKIQDRTLRTLETQLQKLFEIMESKIQRISDAHSWQLISTISFLKRVYELNPLFEEEQDLMLREFSELLKREFARYYSKDFESYHVLFISADDGAILASTLEETPEVPFAAYSTFWKTLKEHSQANMPLIDHSMGEHVFGIPAVFAYTPLDEAKILGIALVLDKSIFEREYDSLRVISPFVEKISLTLDGKRVCAKFPVQEEFNLPGWSYGNLYKRYVYFEVDSIRGRTSVTYGVHLLLNFYTVFIMVETALLFGFVILLSAVLFLQKFSKKISSEMVKVEMAIREFGEHGFLYVTPHDSEVSEVDETLKTFATLSEIIAANIEELTATNQELETSYKSIQKLHEELKDVFYDFTFKLAMIVEGFEENTGEHLQRVRFIVSKIADQLIEDEELRQEVVQYSLLHDIGKIFVPHEILTKPGALTPEEWEIMKKHTTYAERVLDHPRFRVALNIAKYHHENYDGTGYPEGLVGEQIPLEARIVKLADIYDALTSNRPYKKAFTKEEALRIIFEGDGRVMPSHFDPKVLEAFRRIVDEL